MAVFSAPLCLSSSRLSSVGERPGMGQETPVSIGDAESDPKSWRS